MQKFSLINKKIFSIILLSFFIGSGLLYTQNITNAQGRGSYENCIRACSGNYRGNPIGFGNCSNNCTLAYPAATNPQAANCDWEDDGDIFPFKSLAGWIADFIVLLPQVLANFAANLSSFVIKTVLKMNIIGSDGAALAFKNAWTLCRDLGNMIIVLGFVIIGVATALRIREYEAKQFFGKLVIAALLINFSSLMCGMIIDASNLTMGAFLGSSNPASGNNQTSTTCNPNDSNAPLHCMATIFYSNLNSTVNQVFCDIKTSGDVPKYFSASIMFSLVFLVIAFAFICFALLLIVRYGALGLLYIFSPLALVFWFFPFPGAKALGQKWMHNFLKWAFSGVILCFFLWLAGNMIKTFATGAIDIQTATPVPGTNGFWETFFYMLIVISMIIIGIYVTIKTSGGIAGAAMSTAVGVAGLAGGAIAGAAGRAIANSRAGQAVGGALQNLSNRAGKTMESVGLRQTGTTAKANAAKLEEQTKTLAAGYAAAKATGDINTINRVQRMAQQGGRKGAAAMRVLSDAGDLGNIAPKDNKGNADLSKLSQQISYAESMGAHGIREKEEKKNPLLKAFNDNLVNDKLKNTGGIRGSSLQEIQKAREDVVADGFRKANVSDIREFGSDALKSKDFALYTPVSKKRKASDMMSEDKVNSMRSGAQHIKELMEIDKKNDAKNWQISTYQGSSEYQRLKKLHDETVVL
jgi:hypothetical protein